MSFIVYTIFKIVYEKCLTCSLEDNEKCLTCSLENNKQLTTALFVLTLSVPQRLFV